MMQLDSSSETKDVEIETITEETEFYPTTPIYYAIIGVLLFFIAFKAPVTIDYVSKELPYGNGLSFNMTNLSFLNMKLILDCIVINRIKSDATQRISFNRFIDTYDNGVFRSRQPLDPIRSQLVFDVGSLESHPVRVFSTNTEKEDSIYLSFHLLDSPATLDKFRFIALFSNKKAQFLLFSARISAALASIISLTCLLYSSPSRNTISVILLHILAIAATNIHMYIGTSSDLKTRLSFVLPAIFMCALRFFNMSLFMSPKHTYAVLAFCIAFAFVEGADFSVTTDSLSETRTYTPDHVLVQVSSILFHVFHVLLFFAIVKRRTSLRDALTRILQPDIVIPFLIQAILIRVPVAPKKMIYDFAYIPISIFTLLSESVWDRALSIGYTHFKDDSSSNAFEVDAINEVTE